MLYISMRTYRIEFIKKIDGMPLEQIGANLEQTLKNASALMKIEVRKLVTRRTVSVPLGTSVQDAARVMTEHGVSSLVILGAPPGVTGSAGQGLAMAGITTDRDLRTRVLAEGLALDTPVEQIMSPNPITIQADDSVFEAMLSMLRHNIHHLPVLSRNVPVGVINLADIVRYESRSSLYLVNSIFNRQSVAELQALVPDLRATFLRLVNEQATAHMIGSALSGIGRSLTQRLLELAEEKLGPPPVPYCFMVLGSMARDEQLIVTDQDNALVLDDRFDADEHDAYFAELAQLFGAQELRGDHAKGYRQQQHHQGPTRAAGRRWKPLLCQQRSASTDDQNPAMGGLHHQGHLR